MHYRLGLIDYGMGNLHSVRKAFSRLQRPLITIRHPSEISQCDALVLPGVGAFDPAMEQLKKSNLISELKTFAQEGKPLLGICLGLQLLFESSEEGSLEGLGLLKGHVERLPDDQGERIPHMGWAHLNPTNQCPLIKEADKSNWMYFVHSYAAVPTDLKDLAATARFGTCNVTAIVWKDRLGACQFHPEKSAKSGQRLLHRWIKWLDNGAKPPL